MATIPFRELVHENRDLIKSQMFWTNYDLNDNVLPVVEDLKEHAVQVLERNYGRYQVEPDILDELLVDVFTYFPSLMQELAISRLFDAYTVAPEDEESETLTRTEEMNQEVQQNSQLTLGTKSEETTEEDTEQKTTGTVSVEGTTDNTQTSTTNIENTSGVEMTGNRSVNITHNLPEQALPGGTGYFPTDPEGTPILTASYIQTASENFNTHNPIDSTETSHQMVVANAETTNDQVTTNDVTVANTGTTSRTVENSGSDSSQSLTNTDALNTITETRERKLTNKQYAYELRAFLDSVSVINAFERWADKFSWVVGIL